MAFAPWTSRIIHKGTDSPLGRWSYFEFVGKNHKCIIVVSGYQVCDQKFDATSNTVSSQQICILQTQGYSSPQPRLIFLDDLIRQVNQWRLEQKEVIICMDANEPLDDPKAAINRLYNETDLVDLHYHRYPSLRKPATHQRGSRPIDLIAGSPLATKALLHTWMHPFGDPISIKGDHRMLGVDFDPEVLFGNAVATPLELPLRGTNSRHEQKVLKFCKRVIQKCNQHQLADRMADLQSHAHLEPHHFDELEAIEQELTKILLQADRACKPLNFAPWSPELDQAYLQHQLWTIALTAHCTKCNMLTAINLIRQWLTPSHLDEQEQNCSLLVNLRCAQKEL